MEDLALLAGKVNTKLLKGETNHWAYIISYILISEHNRESPQVKSILP